MSRAKRTLGRAVIILTWVCLGGAMAVWAAPPLAGRIISLQGQVAVRPSGAGDWRPAAANQELYAGDAVRTGPASRAAILCMDESQIKLNENTLLVLKRVAPSPRLGGVAPTAEPAPASVYQVLQGEIWLRNKNEKFRFELETPTVTATIRGTEFNLRVKPDGSTNVILLEGNVCLVNPQGEVCLRPGEEGVALPGQAPTKRVLVQPEDAVQWVLYYPGIFSYRDLELTLLPEAGRTPPGREAVASLVRQGEAAYNQGNLSQAKQEAEAALKQDLENGRALTLLGWVSLQLNAPEEALGYFRRVRQADAWTVIGAALARYRLGDVAGAYETMVAAQKQFRPTALLVTMSSYFALLAGKVEQAKAGLETVAPQGPVGVLARSLLAQIYLVQNRKEAALSEASQALALSPGSPMALLSMALAKMASFDLPGATQYLEKSTAADPRFVDAYVYLARIWLGSDYLARARKTIEQALRLAPREAEVLSLAGFIHLAYRDYAGARELWARAIKDNPTLGEPHLGLSLCHFRYREFDRGLTEMLTATLLEPRVALYQSALGKALYQVRTFDKALEVYDYAKTLDPKDPTPYLYKGIALSDLNRPGEAIQEIDRSIALNDNTAIFRSRLMLDRDLAVRNYNLARAYNQLGLNEWAFSKAVTAVKNDPTNSSAHLFLANSYQEPIAINAERLFYRVLAPANESTFFYLHHNDYTPMFEMPYWRADIQGGIGSWQGKKTNQDQDANIYGGWPGTAFYADGSYFDDQGFRPSNSTYRFSQAEAAVKWEPTVSGVLTGFYQYTPVKQGDVSHPNDFGYNNTNPYYTYNTLRRVYELAYLHRFSPHATLLVYGAYQTWFRHLDSLYSYTTAPYIGITDHGLTRSDWEFHDVQAQKQLVLGSHTFMGGFDYFSGNLKYNDLDYFFYRGLYYSSRQSILRPPQKTYSFYLLDYWRLAPGLLIEWGLFKDFSKNVRDGYGQPLSNSLWSPRFGLNWQINPQHTVRLALTQHLDTHLFLQPLLVPTEVASFPWVTNVQSGSKVKEAGVVWEAQWDRKTFSVLRLSALQVATPDWTGTTTTPTRIWWGWKTYQASLIANRILSTSWGLSAGLIGRRIVPDNPDPTPQQLLGQDFTEGNAFLGLAYLHHTGWQGGIKTFLVTQHLKDRAGNLFGLVNLRLGKEFANKRGLATFEVLNLFNRHFYYALEPMQVTALQEPEEVPVRRFVFKLALWF